MKSVILFSVLIVIFLSAGCKKTKSRGPNCEITNPTNFTLVGKGTMVPIFIYADDPEGNNLQLQIYIDDSGIGSTNIFPYKYIWNTTGYSNGDHTIKVIAINNLGHRSTDSKIITIGVSKPDVHTSDIKNISLTSAFVGGTIITDGGANVTETGVFWSIEPEAQNSGTKLRISNQVDSFSVILKGLTTKTLYYVKAYAVNSEGISYGEEKQFTTQGFDIGTFVDTRDNREYKWVTIGNQTWMAENLAYLPFVNSPLTGSSYYKYYYVYDYDGTDLSTAKSTENYKNLGVLYNFSAAIDAAPPGWHLPNDEEWMELEKSLGMGAYDVVLSGWRGVEGRLLKSSSGWYQEGNGNNFANFTAVPAGYRIYDGSFKYLGKYNDFWTSSEYSNTDAWIRYLYYNNNGIYRGTFDKTSGFSIRCIKD